MSKQTICPFASLRRGADWGLNGARTMTPEAGVVHTTQGTGESLITLGQTRHHSTPGTFHFLVMQDGRLYQFYPVNVRCSHAAGANHRAAATAECEGFSGQPFPKPQLETLGRLVKWYAAEWSIPLTFLVGDARTIGQGQASSPRIYLDQSDYRGFLNHAAVDYPPDRSLNHYDGITQAEWDAMIDQHPAEEDPDMFTFTGKDGTLKDKTFVVGPAGKRPSTKDEANVLLYAGVKHFDFAEAQYKFIPDAPTGGGGSPAVPLKVSLTGTATP